MQHQAAQADYLAQLDAYNRNVAAAHAAARHEQGQLTLRLMQEEEATHQKLQLSRLEEAEARAEAEVGSAAAGVSGISVDNLVADIGRRSSLNRATEITNWQWTAAQLQTEQDAVLIRAENRIASMPRPQKPSSSAFAVNVLGAGVRAAGMIM